MRCGLGSRVGKGTRSMGSGETSPRRFERRWAPRFQFRADLEIEWGSVILRASTRDISSSGIFIESPDPLWVGAGFTARLALPTPLRLTCAVKRIEPGQGMGVSVSLAEKTEQAEYLGLVNSLSGNQS